MRFQFLRGHARRGPVEALWPDAPARTRTRPGLEQRLEQLWETGEGLYARLATVDHKIIGVRYLLTAIVFLLAGGVEAMLMRLQLSAARLHVMGPETYNKVFSLHGITMIFWYAAPILSGFGNYFLPLVLGARDMAFPRANALSYWMFLASGLFLYTGVLFGQIPDGGWFAYVPLTSERYSPGLGIDFYALALVFLTLSTTVGSVNFIVTILHQRAPGMAVQRMPLLSYSTLTTSVLSLLALPALTAACLFLELDRQWGFSFFDISRGGAPLLWQHVFWFFGHPWVYVVFLPATGMISMLLPVFARRPIVGYPVVAISTVMTGFVGMGVWVHHMFSVGMSHMAMSFFSAASMTISVFSTIQVFAWVATLWLGTPVRTTSLLFALGFISTFVFGGLSGVTTALIPVDWQVTDTYFVVAHLHYVLIGANVFPVLAAFYYWLPKITGRMLDEKLGRWSFWLTLIGFHVGFFPMHLAGLLGMPRRVYTYGVADGFETLNLVTTAGVVVLSAGLLLTIVNFVLSKRGGAEAGANPWNADTLEWETESPPPAYGASHIHRIHGRSPLWEAQREHPAEDTWTLDAGRLALATGALDADVRGVSKMPEDTIVPLVLTVALAGVFASLLLARLDVAAAFALASALVAAAWFWPEPEKKAA